MIEAVTETGMVFLAVYGGVALFRDIEAWWSNRPSKAEQKR